MTQTPSNSSPLMADRFGARVAQRLSDASNELPHDISERLRAARVQAVDKRKWVLTQSASVLFANSRSGIMLAGHGDGHSNWWTRLGAVGLLLTLVLGLFAIDVIQDELMAQELADIDSALLTDDLPPAAYLDAGFAQFLKTSNRQEP
jgi:trans-aconitate methyltransferase